MQSHCKGRSGCCNAGASADAADPAGHAPIFGIQYLYISNKKNTHIQEYFLELFRQKEGSRDTGYPRKVPVLCAGQQV